jgi:hypothetical protein
MLLVEREGVCSWFDHGRPVIVKKRNGNCCERAFVR